MDIKGRICHEIRVLEYSIGFGGKVAAYVIADSERNCRFQRRYRERISSRPTEHSIVL